MGRPLDVLVYSGTGTSTESVRHCLYSLRRILSPYFAVIPVGTEVLLNEPWTASCAILVFPGGADLGYCRMFDGAGNRKIAQYVRKGGSYLGFCAGGYYGSSYCEFAVGDPELEVVGSRELSFFTSTCKGPAFEGFRYSSEAGARAAKLVVRSMGSEESYEFHSYFNGGGVFVNAANMQDKGVCVLANYAEGLDVESGAGQAAVVHCKVGNGNVILMGPHPEFAAVNLNPNSGISNYGQIVEAIARDEDKRACFLRTCLKRLGLELPESNSVLRPLSRIHISTFDPSDIAALLHRLNTTSTTSSTGIYIFEGGADEFIFKVAEPNKNFAAQDLVESLTQDTADKIMDYNEVAKTLVFHTKAFPQCRDTHHFDHHLYFTSLRSLQQKSRSSATQFGTFLIYGDVVTSTNSMLEKNPKLLYRLPNGTTMAATVQVAGRGRGSNVWISPMGSLIFSTYVQHVLSQVYQAPVIFIQYLMGIAVVEAVKSYGSGYDDLPLRLKWPNDIYAEDPTTSRRPYVKLGGILVNSSFSDSTFHLVVGVGLNTTNAAPTTSLNHVLAALNKCRQKCGLNSLPQFRLECLLARILVRFEEVYYKFCVNGFGIFEQTYYRHWLHTGQLVQLEMLGGIQARIKGITMDQGLLIAEEIGGRRTHTLQCDGNSFDFFQGLVKTKT